MKWDVRRQTPVRGVGLVQDPGKKQGKPALTPGAGEAGRRDREPEEAIEEEGGPRIKNLE